MGVDRVDVMQIHSSGAIEQLGFEGSLSRSEVPDSQREFFDVCDRDKDGFVSLPELTDALRARTK